MREIAQNVYEACQGGKARVRCLFPGRASALLRVTKCINTPLLPFSREGTRMVNGPAQSRKANLARERALDQALGDFSSILWFPPRQRAALAMVPRQMKRSQPWNTFLGCSCISFESCQAEFLAVCSGSRRQGALEGKPASQRRAQGEFPLWLGGAGAAGRFFQQGLLYSAFWEMVLLGNRVNQEPCRAARVPRCAAWVCGKGTAWCRWRCRHQLEMLLGAKTHRKATRKAPGLAKGLLHLWCRSPLPPREQPTSPAPL